MCMADGLVNAHRGCFGGRPSVGTWNGDDVPRSPFRKEVYFETRLRSCLSIPSKYMLCDLQLEPSER